MGALLALGRALKLMGKQVTMYYEGGISFVYGFLPSVCDLSHHLVNDPVFDTAVILNRTDYSQLEITTICQRGSPVVIYIDSHEILDGFSDIHCFDSTACGLTEMVYRMIKALPVIIDRQMAKAIYAGILTDTGSFRMKNTNREAFAISAEMLGLGVRPNEVAGYLYDQHTLGQVKLLNRAINSLEMSEDGKVAVMILTQDDFDKTKTDSRYMDSVIQFARRIHGDVRLTAIASELEKRRIYPVGRHKRFQIRLWSRGDLNASYIAGRRGGSGSFETADFKITATPDQIKNLFFNLPEMASNGFSDQMEITYGQTGSGISSGTIRRVLAE